MPALPRPPVAAKWTVETPAGTVKTCSEPVKENVVVSALAGLYGLYVFGKWLSGAELVSGWTSTILVVSLLGGILNSLHKFWVNAAAPILLNLTLIAHDSIKPDSRVFGRTWRLCSATFSACGRKIGRVKTPTAWRSHPNGRSRIQFYVLRDRPRLTNSVQKDWPRP